MCCSKGGEGSYNMTHDGAMEVSGGGFSSSESTTFRNPLGKHKCKKIPLCPSIYLHITLGLDWIKDTAKQRWLHWPLQCGFL